jgi:hypothetical protein
MLLGDEWLALLVELLKVLVVGMYLVECGPRDLAL